MLGRSACERAQPGLRRERKKKQCQIVISALHYLASVRLCPSFSSFPAALLSLSPRAWHGESRLPPAPCFVLFCFSLILFG